MMKKYIKKKINEILRTRAIKAEWRKNIQKEMQIFFNQFEKIIDEEFKKNTNTLINFLNEGKSFDDLIDINFIKNEGKFIVYNNFSTTTLSINPKFKCLEIKKYSFPKTAFYNLNDEGIENAKLDFIDAIAEQFQYETHSGDVKSTEDIWQN